MAETPRLQARKRVPDPVHQQAPRPGLQLPAKTLPSYAKSGNVAIAQSLIHRRHMSEPPRPIGVDSIVTLCATQVHERLVSATEHLVRRAVVRHLALDVLRCSCARAVAESTHRSRGPLQTHRHRSGPATPPETRRQEFQGRRPMPERRCIRCARARAEAREWRVWDAIVSCTRAHARCGVRMCADWEWLPLALQGHTGATQQRQSQESAFPCAVSSPSRRRLPARRHPRGQAGPAGTHHLEPHPSGRSLNAAACASHPRP